MLIDLIDISIFKAKQLKVDIQTSELSNNSEWIKGALSPFFDENIIGFKTIKLELCFQGDNKDETLKNISNFMAKCLKAVTLKLDGYTRNYKCILKDNETTSTVSSEVFIKTLTFIGFEFGILTLGVYFVLPLCKIPVPTIPTEVWMAFGAILGVASWYRGRMQADPNIPTNSKG